MQTGYNEQVYYSQWNQTKMYLTMSGIPLTGISVEYNIFRIQKRIFEAEKIEL